MFHCIHIKMAETSGDRLYLIRLACGDGLRTAEPLEAFAKRVKKATGVSYSPMTLSLLERMKQKWKVEDARVLAAVDPLKRGPAWLSALAEDLGPDQFIPAPRAHAKRRRDGGG